MKATSAYLFNAARPIGEFYCRPFYMAAYWSVHALHALLDAIHSFVNVMFVEDGCTAFSAFEISLTRTVTITVLQIFLDNMKLSDFGNGSRWKSTEKEVKYRSIN